jgi:hypothetical protein
MADLVRVDYKKLVHSLMIGKAPQNPRVDLFTPPR